MTRTQSGTFKRLPREDRRDELLDAAVALAFDDGLGKITARRVAARVGVAQGLVTHYFGSIDELLAAAFERAAEAERDELDPRPSSDPVADMRRVLGFYVSHDRDPAALLWLDAWRESAHRPAVRQAVIRQMEGDVADLDAIIEAGIASGAFPEASAKSPMRIIALVDGLAANAAVRAGLDEPTLDYANVTDFVFATAERELGLPPGALQPED
ncbi:MAG TPA: TetR family transcriptional regulator [Agromyces sp.]